METTDKNPPVDFNSFPEGYQAAMESLKFIPEKERKAFFDSLINMLLTQ